MLRWRTGRCVSFLSFIIRRGDPWGTWPVGCHGEAALLVRFMLTLSETEEEQYSSGCPAVDSGHGIYGFDIKKRKTLTKG